MSLKDDKPERRRRRRVRHRRPKRKRETDDRFDSLKRKLEQGPLGGQQEKIVIEPTGQVKMSEVLEAFVAPYLEETASIEEDRKLFTLASAAWNAALFPEDQREEMVDDLLRRIAGGDKALKAGMKEIMNELIGRKLKRFADIERVILSTELIDKGDGYELQVASTFEPPE